MNKVIKRNNHLNITHGTDMTDTSDANNNKNLNVTSKNKLEYN